MHLFRGFGKLSGRQEGGNQNSYQFNDKYAGGCEEVGHQLCQQALVNYTYGNLADYIEILPLAQIAKIAKCPQMNVRSVVPVMRKIIGNRHFP